MSVFEAVLYGILQGLTEFLPVSSSGHLAILEHFLGLNGPVLQDPAANFLTVEILLHLATLTAVFLVYFREICSLLPAAGWLISRLFVRRLRGNPLTEGERMVLYLLIATLPMAAAALLKDRLAWLYADVRVVGMLLLVNGCLLRLADRPRKAGKLSLARSTPADALMVGMAQVFAVLPGLSRSGCTITAAMTRGFSREFAVKFSFLLSIPAILGANLAQLPGLLASPIPMDQRPALLAGMLAAFLSGIAAMKLLHWISRRATFRLFGWYCWLAGTLTVLAAYLF